MMALTKKSKILLVNAQHQKYNMERALLSTNGFMEHLEDIGIDVLFRNQMVNNITPDTIKNAAISYYSEHLHFIPGTTKGNLLQYNQNLKDLFPAIYETSEKIYDFVFIDAPDGYGEATQMLLNESDCIVVNLPPYKPVIDDYFNKYHLPSEKLLYLIGRYDRNSRYNIRNLVRSFNSMRNKIAAVPYNVGFMDALSDAEIIRYLQKNYIEPVGDNEYFIKEVEKAGNLINKKRKGVIT